MGRLLLVRHGQASFLTDDYDQLSQLGEEQSRRLGAYWADRGWFFDRVYVGALRRHRQTHDAVASVYRARGLRWAGPAELPELNEYPAEQVFARLLPGMVERDPALGPLVALLAERGEAAAQAFRQLFFPAMRGWVRGEWPVPDLEPWAAFRARVQAGVQKMIAGLRPGQTAVAFTSGGPIAAATGWVTGRGDEETLELSWKVRNAAFAEFILSAPVPSLGAFNAVPHLTDPEVLTYL